MQDRLKEKSLVRWAIKWHSKNKLDGITEHFIFAKCVPKFFLRRKIARRYANEKYGYIKTRKDLREEPHGWRFPRAVKVRITIEEI